MSHKVSTAVYDHSQSAGSARLVLLAMADEASDYGELTAYRRSYSHLARKANVTKNTVRVAIRQLQDLGEVEVLREGDGRASSDYRIVLPGLGDEGAQSKHPGGADEAPRVIGSPTQGAPDEHPIIPFSPGTSPSSPSSPTAFEAFWSSYPRKEGKGAARKAFATAAKKAQVFDILAGAQRYRDDPNRDPGYTAHPATWLNQERWDDDPLPPRSNGNGSVGSRTVRNLQQMQEKRRALGPPPLQQRELGR